MGILDAPPLRPENSLPNAFNLKPEYLAKWRAALGNVLAGGGRAKLACIGDSTTAGYGAGSPSYAAAYAGSYPSRLIPLLTKNLVTCADNSVFGTKRINNAPTNPSYNSYDARVTYGTGWAPSDFTMLGGGFHNFTGASPGTLSFTPAGQFDTIEFYYAKNTGFGDFTANVDGGASLGTVTTSAATAAQGKTTFTVAKNTHTINVNAAGNGRVALMAIRTFDSTASYIDLLQMATYGGTVGDIIDASAPFSALNNFATYAPDLSIICLTINDANAGVPIPTYTSRLQSVITAAKAVGDVILMAGVPVQLDNAAAYITACKSLALTNNTPFISLPGRWVSYASANPLLMYADTVHPSARGYSDVALFVSDVLERA